MMSQSCCTQRQTMGISYTIKPNDTLSKLAKKFNTTMSAIISANAFFNPDFLQSGQQIFIPFNYMYPSHPEYIYYIVRSGDTLYSISYSFNISIDDIVQSNFGINPHKLFAGQVLCIPSNSAYSVYASSYTVEKGDTFSGIAQKFNTTVDALIMVNPDVKCNTLTTGQQIYIPTHM